jgi:DNA-directed RNA polymerase subunit RPC12/RpoP
MMNEQETKETFVVQCIWCGATIRDDKTEETSGVCLECFYKILNNHLHAQKQTVYGEFVSDR